MEVYETWNQDMTHASNLLGCSQIVMLYVNARVVNLSIARRIGKIKHTYFYICIMSFKS